MDVLVLARAVPSFNRVWASRDFGWRCSGDGAVVPAIGVVMFKVHTKQIFFY